MKKFTSEPLLEITTWIQEALKTSTSLSFIVPDPDQENNRSFKAWVNLAELHFCKLLIPKPIDENFIQLTFQKLNQESSFHSASVKNKEEKYGTNSIFFDINKNEEPTFLHAYKKALEAVKVEKRKHILNLGINKGDEFELIQQLIETETFDNINFTGIDHSQTALNHAKKRFPKDNVQFFQQDINTIKELQLQKSDLIISIGTLQSPSINYKPFLMSLVQEHLTYDGAFILGFPNSRWIDGELIYGAKAPNYPYSEMSLLYNDVIFAKKYLQQKKFRVTITGREYIFLTATRIGL
ncbi:MAG: Methyltransferase type 11 [uncultured Sulfurovum sp.]|uniref:Methyltransferase type 11 n=1 Tax=uncultured Sulfurovum sp. TaxID=269237 RepID=A0A6S6S623_9BACT|nr:MAG: Methyltransferase type 11 [uncultured Sulfurovum sp.]